MHIPRAIPLLLLAGLYASAAGVHAQKQVVIYRCTGPDGTVTVQNDRACPKGDQQDRRVMQGVATAPAPATPPRPTQPATAVVPAPPPVPLVPAPPLPEPAASPVAPAATPPTATYTTAPPVSTADDQPPPALFTCRTPDNSRYFSVVANPPPRCAALQTTGIGTAPPAGSACEIVSDTCAPVPAEALCDSWRQHLNELEAALTFGRMDERETARVELDRANGAVRDSLCGR